MPVKLLLMLALTKLLLSLVRTAIAVRLVCGLRTQVLVSRFDYHLGTMKWGHDFEVASGIVKGRTASGILFELTAFLNGDNLV